MSDMHDDGQTTKVETTAPVVNVSIPSNGPTPLDWAAFAFFSVSVVALAFVPVEFHNIKSLLTCLGQAAVSLGGLCKTPPWTQKISSSVN
jgi:hypothetical protein